MKKIGLVGGTGPESTVMYYKALNTRTDELTGGKAMPEIAIESVDFRRAWELVCAEDLAGLADYLSEKVACLKESGAEVIALTAVTMHSVLGDVEKNTGVKLVSIPAAVCGEVIRRGYKKVGLLGTKLTMESDFMKDDMISAGIEVFVPDKADRELTAKRIYEELELGIVKESTRRELNDIILKMKEEHGVEAVILGCTELPLILNDENCPLPCIDSVNVHIEKLVDMALD